MKKNVENIAKDKGNQSSGRNVGGLVVGIKQFSVNCLLEKKNKTTTTVGGMVLGLNFYSFV